MMNMYTLKVSVNYIYMPNMALFKANRGKKAVSISVKKFASQVNCQVLNKFLMPLSIPLLLEIIFIARTT